MESTKTEKNNNQQLLQTNNINVTVIPVDLARSRAHSSQNSDFILEQYR